MANVDRLPKAIGQRCRRRSATMDMDGRQRRNRRDRLGMLTITVAAALIIIVVLYFAGGFSRSTG